MAIDLLRIGLAEQPNFLPLILCYITALLFTWSKAGSTPAKLIREDYLEEAMGLLLTLQHLQETQGHPLLPPETSIIKKAGYFPYLMEKAYFWNAFRLVGSNVRTLSLIGCWVISCLFTSVGKNSEKQTEHAKEAIQRAKKLFHTAKQKASYRDSEAVHLRVAVIENFFECSFESIHKQRVMNKELRGDGGGVSNGVYVDVECFRCGDAFLVRGQVGGKGGGKGGEGGKVMIRPLILLPEEVTHVLTIAVNYYIHHTKQSETDVHNKPKWKILSEFVCLHVRVVSCGGRWGERTASLIPALRLVLPMVEYMRQERNGYVCVCRGSLGGWTQVIV